MKCAQLHRIGHFTFNSFIQIQERIHFKKLLGHVFRRSEPWMHKKEYSQIVWLAQHSTIWCCSQQKLTFNHFSFPVMLILYKMNSSKCEATFSVITKQRGYKQYVTPYKNSRWQREAVCQAWPPARLCLLATVCHPQYNSTSSCPRLWHHQPSQQLEWTLFSEEFCSSLRHNNCLIFELLFK